MNLKKREEDRPKIYLTFGPIGGPSRQSNKQAHQKESANTTSWENEAFPKAK